MEVKKLVELMQLHLYLQKVNRLLFFIKIQLKDGLMYKIQQVLLQEELLSLQQEVV